MPLSENKYLRAEAATITVALVKFTQTPVHTLQTITDFNLNNPKLPIQIAQKGCDLLLVPTVGSFSSGYSPGSLVGGVSCQTLRSHSVLPVLSVTILYIVLSKICATSLLRSCQACSIILPGSLGLQ